MNRIALAFVMLLSAGILPAQDVTYVIFNRDCMNQLVYRYAYPNVKGEDPVFAYSVKPNALENYVFTGDGAGHYSPSLPNGAVTCKSLSLSDGFAASVNNQSRQMVIVFQRQEGGYLLMPVSAATLIARSGSKYWVRSKNCSFTFDTLHLENDVNLAVSGSPTAVYYKGAQLNNCLTAYSFHCEASKGSPFRSDVELIPSIGFTSDRSGATSAKALENEMQIMRVNGKNIDDFISNSCPENTKIAVPKLQKPSEYGYDDAAYGYSEPDKEQASITSSKPAQYDYQGQTVNISCPEKLGEGYHVVQKGDNLRAIARTYGVDVQSLVKWNHIKDPNKIEICQTIWYQKPPVKSTSKGVALKPVQHNAPQNMVVDQRKLLKMSGEKNVAKPQVYSTEDTNYDSWRQPSQTSPKSPAQYEYYDDAQTNSTRPLIHTIKQGEYLYKLAKMYDCPETCIRQANNFPAEGDVNFSIGQRVIIPACDCLKNSSVKGTAPYDNPTGNTVLKQYKMDGNVLSNTPAEVDATPSKPAQEWSVAGDETSKTGSAQVKSDNKKTSDQPKVQQFREHLVRQGDTIRSVATRYKVDPSELALVNGLGLNEDLMPGKWILVPINDGTN